MKIEIPDKSEFQKLKDLINQVIKKSEKYKNDKFSDQAINWADLKCYGIDFVISEDCEANWLVQIDEAAPDSWKFCNYIHDEMQKLGYNVFVETSW